MLSPRRDATGNGQGTSWSRSLILQPQPTFDWAQDPGCAPAPLWACFLLCDSPPGDEAMEPGRGCPVLQEPGGLGLLEPSPGGSLQGLASFPRHLLSLPRVLWARGSPWDLGACLDGLKEGEVVISGPSDS